MASNRRSTKRPNRPAHASARPAQSARPALSERAAPSRRTATSAALGERAAPLRALAPGATQLGTVGVVRGLGRRRGGPRLRHRPLRLALAERKGRQKPRPRPGVGRLGAEVDSLFDVQRDRHGQDVRPFHRDGEAAVPQTRRQAAGRLRRCGVLPVLCGLPLGDRRRAQPIRHLHQPAPDVVECRRRAHPDIQLRGLEVHEQVHQFHAV